MSEPFKSTASPPPFKSTDSSATSLKKEIESLPGRVFRQGALTVIAAVVVGCIATGGTLVYAQAKLDDLKAGVAKQVDAGVVPLQSQLDQHVKDEAEARARQERMNERILDALQGMEDRSAKRFDALQNTVLERRGQPESPELARPAAVKDGGR